MTTFLYTTYSNSVEITDWYTLTTLLDRFEFAVEPTVDETDETLSFVAVDHMQSFGVSDPGSDSKVDTRVFLKQLSDILVDRLEITCVEVQGYGQPAVFKWIVNPHGSVSINKL
ncbi:hypothetical protein [environmental halophage 1 AAJ-2005]|nr:hypothetical protein [environmental halophage 1 AAJ-2005]